VQLTTDEQVLLFAGVGYLIAATLWAMSLSARARAMLRELSQLIEPALWQALGEPVSIAKAMRDPEKRWFRFVNSGDYRRQCSDAAIEIIDDFRMRTKRMLIVLVAAGLLLLIRFWPLLKPEFL
jgi:predicted nucleic acid-binding Zn ribbon protein